MSALVISSVEQTIHSDEWDPYEILGIRRRSTPEQIRSAYRRRAKKLHSDAGGDARAFLLLKEAHDFLMDPVAKSLWDRRQFRATEQECKAARGLLDDICRAVISGLANGDGMPPEHANIPDLMRQVVCSNLNDFATSRTSNQNRLRRLRLMKGKTRRKGKGDNMVARVIENQIAEAEATLDRLKKQIRVGDIMLAELESYECESLPEPPWSGGQASYSTFPSFTSRTVFY
ncbi:J domain-containing protein [Rhizobium sp. YTUHZ045]|uniref:J domain-containing protein n=1 Tax=Rhizobium TaxID=379 RepID=UPI001C82D90C|nr:J domain-containing protein [Rhizobium bangladeshense]MBX4883998.1 J domain-containing protein [Rhizobium bangladeshense]